MSELIVKGSNITKLGIRLLRRFDRVTYRTEETEQWTGGWSRSEGMVMVLTPFLTMSYLRPFLGQLFRGRPEYI